MTLGQRLKRLRHIRGLSTRDIAEKLQIGKGTISNYESNTRRPKYEMLKVLADFYGVTVAYLLGEEQEPKPKKDFTTDELLDILDHDLMIKFAEEKIKLIRFVENTVKEDISLDDLRMAVEIIKNARQKK